jgi:Raf kinase inhibitor-like YbhB/YbcL family protein
MIGRTIMKRILFLLVVALAAPVVAGCGGGDETPPLPAIATAAARQETISFTSTAFGDGESIPVKYTCDGENVSPPLEWGQPPAGTQSLALVVDDPDAPSGRFVHWVIYDLPPTLRGLPEGVSTDEKPSQGGTNGNNGVGRSGYRGPCPPSGTHRYFFRLYALDTKLDAAAGLTKEKLPQAMEGHVLAQAELMGVYSRTK